ncbi:hypothetical protein MLD38_020237 [Melastoma candidum]|uniref:Uncharacterized protein n=1 Tax=Melastoma candidum TaxID=119954 RepID=A0ACB9QFB6_9MYRT|nr:hypothetical protein MLD38_020237 [Melastoma candidum]
MMKASPVQLAGRTVYVEERRANTAGGSRGGSTCQYHYSNRVIQTWIRMRSSRASAGVEDFPMVATTDAQGATALNTALCNAMRPQRARMEWKCQSFPAVGDGCLMFLQRNRDPCLCLSFLWSVFYAGLN